MSTEERIKVLEIEVQELKKQLVELVTVLHPVIEAEQHKQMVSAHWQGGDS
jgi:hypothetical protein